MGRHHPQDIVRGGRFSLLEGGYGRTSRPLDNFPVSASSRPRVGPKGLGSFRSSAASPPVPLPPCSSGPSPPPLAGVVLALAFEPVGASYLIPFAVAAYVLVTLAACPVRRGLAPGPRLRDRLLLRPDVLDARGRLRRLAGPLGLEASFYGLLGLVAPVLVPLPRLAGPARRRLGGDGGGPVQLAVRRHALGPARLRHGGHPLGEGPPVRRQQRRQPAPGAARRHPGLARRRARAGPGSSPPLALGGVLAVSLLPALAPYSADISDETTVAVVQGNVPGDGDDILLDHRQVTQNHVDATVAARRRGRGRVTSRSPTSCSGRRTPPPSTRSRTPRSTPTSSRRPPRSASRSWSARWSTPGPEHVLNQGIVWDPDTGGGDRYTKRHPVPFGEYIPWRSVFRDNFGRLALIPRDMLTRHPHRPARGRAASAVADAICFDVAYDDGIHAQLAQRRRAARRADLQRDVHPHRPDRPAVRDHPAPGARDRPLRAGRGHQRRLRRDRPRRHRARPADPRTQDVLVEQIGLSDVAARPRCGSARGWTGPASAVTLVALRAGGAPVSSEPTSERPRHAWSSPRHEPSAGSSWSSRPTTRPTTSPGSSGRLRGGAARRRRARRRRQLARRHRRDRRRAGRRRPAGARAAPRRPRAAWARRTSHGFARRLERRLRRHRRDGRRRLPPARAAAPAARRRWRTPTW